MTPLNDVELLEDEEELKDPKVIQPLVEQPNKEEEKTLRDTLPKWATDPSVMKKANIGKKLWHSIFFGDYHPSQLAGLKKGERSVLDHTKEELRELDARDWAKIHSDRLGEDIQNEFNYFSDAVENKEWGKLAARPIYGAARTVLPRDLANTVYLGGTTALTGTTAFLSDVATRGAFTQDIQEFEQAINDAIYGGAGELTTKLQGQMTKEERQGDAARTEIVGALVSAKIWFAALDKLGKFKHTKALASLVDPRTAKSAWGLLAKGYGFSLIEELTTAMTTDPRISGSFVSMFNEDWDPAMTAGQTRTQAYVNKVLFDVPLGVVISGLADIAPAIKEFPGWKELYNQTIDIVTPAFQRAKRSKSYTRKADATRAKLEVAGIIKKDDTDIWLTTDTSFPTAEGNEAALRDKFIPAEQDKPEVDTVIQTIDDSTTREGTAEIKERVDAGEDLVEVVNEVTEREEIAAVPDANFGLSTAPSSSLVGSQYYDQLDSIDLPTLRAVASDEKFALDVLSITGTKPADAKRLDLIEAFKQLEEKKGISILPNRLTGQPILPTSELIADPVRFQYKQNVNELGVQKGGSLEGVEKWNPDLEGIIDVWEDPKDGKTYIVNGHNRVDKANELGIKSLRVNYLVANSAAEARAKGALSNIASGSGTGVDAAKFFKAQGVTQADELVELGLPLASGKASEGLALAKLPENIFQDFINQKITRSKAMALGASGLDEASMQQAYKALLSKDMSDATFAQVIEQAKTAPVIEGDQVDLFGNTDTLNLMVEKGRLAAAIEKDLKTDRTLFARVKKNAQRLKEGGTTVDKEASQQIVSDAGLAIEQFNAQKYTQTRLSQLLNDGAIELQKGGKIGPIKRRIQKQFVESLSDAELQKPIDIPAPPEPPAPTKNELLEDIAKTALKNKQVRPPSTTIPSSPEVDDVDLNKAFTGLGKAETNQEYAKLVDNETRLREEQGRIDESIEADKLAKERTETKYYEKTYEEKKKAGLLDDLRKDISRGEDSLEAERRARSMYGLDATKVSDDEVKQIAQMGEVRLNDEFKKFGNKTLTERKIKNRVNKLKDFEKKQEKWFEINKDIDLGQKAGKDGNRQLTSAEELALDKETKKGKKIMLERRIQKIDIAEQELYDHNYLQALKREKAKRDFINREIVSKRIFEGETGKAFNRLVLAMDKALGHKWKGGIDTVGDVANVLNVARRTTELSVYKALEDFEKVTTSKAGRRLNVDEQFPFIKPFLSKDAGYRARLKEQRMLRKNNKLQSSITGIDYTNGNYDEMYYRRYLKRLKDREGIRAADSLAEYGRNIAEDFNGRILQSKELTAELLDDMKDALRISGIPLNNLKVFDEINMIDRFSAEEIARTTAEWDAGRATFISQNPDDPLTRTAAGTTGGLYVPSDYYREKIQQSIYLALYPALNQRLGGLLSNAPEGGRPFSWTLFHEAFHGVQDLIRRLNLDATSLDSTESIKEMVGIIKKYGGNFEPGMSNNEIQAEAFGIWATNRKIKLTKGGFVKTSFERLKKFLQSLRIKYDLLRKKDLGYADIFEIAAKGNIAKVAAIEKLSDHQLFFMSSKLNAWSHQHAPQLTMRVFNYLEAKKADYDNLLNGANNQFITEGC